MDIDWGMQFYSEKRLKAKEAFLRRAVTLDSPFIIKGSIITAQYFSGIKRRVNDMDWVCTKPIKDVDEACSFFSQWVREVMRVEVNDGHSLSEYDGELLEWHEVDYAMSQQSPTLGVSIYTSFMDYDEKETVQLDIQITFNLLVDFEPEPFHYFLESGDMVLLPKVPPLYLQVSWKVHQCLERARFKDFLDLIYLIDSLKEEDLPKMFTALLDECIETAVPFKRIELFLNGQYTLLFTQEVEFDELWRAWRFDEFSMQIFECVDQIIQLDYSEDVNFDNYVSKEADEFFLDLDYARYRTKLSFHLLDFVPELSLKVEEVNPVLYKEYTKKLEEILRS